MFDKNKTVKEICDFLQLDQTPDDVRMVSGRDMWRITWSNSCCGAVILTRQEKRTPIIEVPVFRESPFDCPVLVYGEMDEIHLEAVLAHELTHIKQLTEYESIEETCEAYALNPAPFEDEANLYALDFIWEKHGIRIGYLPDAISKYNRKPTRRQKRQIKAYNEALKKKERNK